MLLGSTSAVADPEIYFGWCQPWAVVLQPAIRKTPLFPKVLMGGEHKVWFWFVYIAYLQYISKSRQTCNLNHESLVDYI